MLAMVTNDRVALKTVVAASPDDLFDAWTNPARHAQFTGAEATGAARVGVTHGYVKPMVRWLSEAGVDAFAVATRYTGERGEEAEAAREASQATGDGGAERGEAPTLPSQTETSGEQGT